MAEAKIDLIISGAQAATTLGDLETSVDSLTDALKGAEIGSEEYNKLEKSLISTSRQVKNLELSFESLDNEQVASEIGSVAGAIGDVTASFILLGGENRQLEEVAQNIEKALGVSIAFKGAIEGVSSARKLWNDQIAKGTKITKISTAVQAAFNKVMKANPIGIIIVAVTALIAGLILLGKNVKAVGEFFVFLKDLAVSALSSVLMFFGLTDKAIETQSMKERKLAKQRVEQEKQVDKAHKKRIAQIIEERDAVIDAVDDTIKALELEKDTLEAQGKVSDAVTVKILEAELEKTKAVLEANRQQVQSGIQKFRDLAALRGQNDEDFKKSLLAQGIDLDKLQEKADSVLFDNERNVQLAENRITKFRRETREKNSALADQARAADLAAEQKLTDEKLASDKLLDDDRLALLERRIKAQNELDKIEINQIKDQDERKKALLVFAFEESILALDETIQQENDLIIAKRLELEEQLSIIDKEKEEREDEATKKQDEEDDQARQNTIDQAFDSAQQLLDITETFAGIVGNKELKRIKEKQARGEALTKNEIKRLQREEKIQKAFALAQVGLDTARGISAAVAAGAGIPFPGNIPAILSGIAAVLGGVAQAQQILGEGSSVDVGSIAGDVGGGGLEAQGENVPVINEIGFGSTLLNQEPQIVAIVDDINDGQDRVASIVEQATFS